MTQQYIVFLDCDLHRFGELIPSWLRLAQLQNVDSLCEVAARFDDAQDAFCSPQRHHIQSASRAGRPRSNPVLPIGAESLPDKITAQGSAVAKQPTRRRRALDCDLDR